MLGYFPAHFAHSTYVVVKGQQLQALDIAMLFTDKAFTGSEQTCEIRRGYHERLEPFQTYDAFRQALQSVTGYVQLFQRGNISNRCGKFLKGSGFKVDALNACKCTKAVGYFYEMFRLNGQAYKTPTSAYRFG